ncbi:MAG: putative metallophosphoesterase [Acidobacteria bacterium]|nr:putative metallophosphoesterase [Acidobacteriota bacterium]
MHCKSIALSGLLSLGLMLALSSSAPAGDPHSAYYDQRNNQILWFMQTSDTHIGVSGTDDSSNLSWLVNDARLAINPGFILVTGDLTDSTNGNIFGYPNGPYQAEWDEYQRIVNVQGITSDNYFDIPGNHDAYNDKYFAYYLANSVQGRAKGRTQASFIRTLGTEKYHFLGINTADNTGKSFSIFWPYGDYAGLDSSELAFISDEMTANPDSTLTLVFGHHPLEDTGKSSDTYVYYSHEWIPHVVVRVWPHPRFRPGFLCSWFPDGRL